MRQSQKADLWSKVKASKTEAKNRALEPGQRDKGKAKKESCEAGSKSKKQIHAAELWSKVKETKAEPSD